MKAAQISEYGDASVVHVVDTDKPTVKQGQVLVEVHASSLNPYDTTIRAGYMKDMIPLELPVTLGGDIAGVVVQIGPGVAGFASGDKVFGQANVVAGNSGAFAEFAATAASQIGAAPENLTFEEAAAMPLVGVSALQALTDHIGLRSGQKIFIHGGAGGIGTIAIQIAKHVGATVATTAKGDGLEVVRALGADEVIDYKTQDFAAVVKNCDAVFDTVGGDDFAKSFAVLKTGGVAVTMIAEVDEAKAEERGITAIRQMTNVTTDALGHLRELIEHEVIKPQVGKVFPLSDIQAAFAARESGQVHGKVVLAIQ